MRRGFFSQHWTEKDSGAPAGGVTQGRGFTISWQNGPLGRDEDRLEPNGAFVEDIIDAAVDRIEFYNRAGFECPENFETLRLLRRALEVQDSRTKSREAAGVEGTHGRRPRNDSPQSA